MWLFLFFVSMIFLGIDSQFGVMEGIYCYLKDEFKSGPVMILGFDISLETSKYMMLVAISLWSPSLTSHAGIYYL
jgi:hypothetical protein